VSRSHVFLDRVIFQMRRIRYHLLPRYLEAADFLNRARIPIWHRLSSHLQRRWREL
jgi:hypothetical protein